MSYSILDILEQERDVTNDNFPAPEVSVSNWRRHKTLQITISICIIIIAILMIMA